MNHDEAAKWQTMAAEKGHSGAQSLLWLCYEYGDGVVMCNEQYHKAIDKAFPPESRADRSCT